MAQQTETTGIDILAGTPDEVIERLKKKTIEVPAWSDLVKEYDPKNHPVMDKTKYPDVVDEDGNTDYVTRITFALQRLAVVKLVQLVVGIPAQRLFSSETEGEKIVAKVIEKVLKRNRINALNIERLIMLYAGCEIATIWYAVEEPNTLYGIDSRLKLRCRTYSPMKGDELYPYFDENDDMKALAVGYKKTVGEDEIEYFDVFTDAFRIRYINDNGWTEELRVPHNLGKIPGVYCYRPTPAWEGKSGSVEELEWSVSRNGNYLRKNLKPYIAIMASEELESGEIEKPETQEFKGWIHLPGNSDIKYVTWEGAIESLKFHIQEVRASFFSELQLADTSFENMKSFPMSGEARKMMFVDPQQKATEESGRLIEMFDREVNVIKAFLKSAQSQYHEDIDAIECETVITPFSITDDKDTVDVLMTATGGKPIITQREGVKRLNWSDNIEKTLEELSQQDQVSLFEPTGV